MVCVTLQLDTLRLSLEDKYDRDFTERDVDYWLRRCQFERIDVDEFAFTGDPWRIVPNPDYVILSCLKM